MGDWHFARSVPGQGSRHAFPWCSSFPSIHCKDFRVWVYLTILARHVTLQSYQYIVASFAPRNFNTQLPTVRHKKTNLFHHVASILDALRAFGLGRFPCAPHRSFTSGSVDRRAFRARRARCAQTKSFFLYFWHLLTIDTLFVGETCIS